MVNYISYKAVELRVGWPEPKPERGQKFGAGYNRVQGFEYVRRGGSALVILTYFRLWMLRISIMHSFR